MEINNRVECGRDDDNQQLEMKYLYSECLYRHNEDSGIN